ncbi:MAG: DUF4097 family beta strand repeat-containing protein [Bacteroidota bacterium]|nr:DUF4097 family beta strand repeat-containing protein [Bacteroidota bacterium]MDE2832974.1 DUF4097 family beta strand repeat-containing protein [Bacteroidota bacterium]MDE2958298.1 DUF4097 family beta strand repeat-containing protein [Bacteroidota bacterium]
MKIFTRPTLLTTVAALVLMAAAVPRERDVIKKEFNVAPGGTLFLDLDYGRVEIESIEEDKVLITMERIATAQDRSQAREMLNSSHRYEFEKRQDNSVHIESRVDRGRRMNLRRQGSIKIRFTIRVPEEFNIDFKSGSGDMTIVDVSGDVRGHTGAGNILLEEVGGTAELTSGAGNVDVQGDDLERVHINTGAGNVTLRGITGSVEANTGAGNMYVEIDDQPVDDSRLRTGAGNLTVLLDEDVSLDFNGKAALGNVTCEFPVEISKSLLSRSFSGSVNGGGVVLEMRAGVGNVILKRQ